MNKKKAAMSLMSLALVGAVAVGGTLAFLTDTTGKVTNTFTMGKGYEDETDPEDPGKVLHTGLWLDETKIPADAPADTRYPSEIGTKLKDRVEASEDGTSGVEYKDLVPGDIMVKDPTFHMVKGSVKSRVVMKVTGLDALNDLEYTQGTGSEKIHAFAINKNKIENSTTATTVLNTGDVEGETWKKIANKEGQLIDGVSVMDDKKLDGYYVYNQAVDAEDAGGTVDLEPLFKYISMNKNLSNEDFADVQDKLKDDSSTEIVVGGVATQWENTTVADTLAFAVEKLGSM